MSVGPLPASLANMAREIDNLRIAIGRLTGAMSAGVGRAVGAGAAAGERLGGGVGGALAGRAGAAIGSEIGGAAFGATMGAVNVAGLAVTATFRAIPAVVRAFSNTIAEASGIVAKFSHISMGGMMAQVQIQIADLRRNMEVSRAVTREMLLFAESTNRARDAFKNVDIEFNKIILKLGASFNDLFAKLAPAVEPFAKLMGKATDQITSFISVISNAYEGLAAQLKPLEGAFRDLGGMVGKTILELTPSLMAFHASLVDVVKNLVPVFNALKPPVNRIIEELGKLAVVAEGANEIVFKAILSLEKSGPLIDTLVLQAGLVTDVLGYMVEAVKDVVNWLRSWAGLEAIDFKKQSDIMAKILDEMRKANLQAQVKAIDMAAMQKIAAARQLMMEGRLPANRMAEANANPFEFFMGKAPMFGARAGQGAGAMAGRFGAKAGAVHQARVQQNNERRQEKMRGQLKHMEGQRKAMEDQFFKEGGRQNPNKARRDRMESDIEGLDKKMEELKDRAKAAGIPVAMNERFDRSRDAMNGRLDLMEGRGPMRVIIV